MRTLMLRRAMTVGAALTIAGAFSGAGVFAAHADPASGVSGGACAQSSVTGTWTVTQSNLPAGTPFTFQLQQSGTSVSGVATYDTGSGPVTGSVSGSELNNQFHVVITWSATSAGDYTATVAGGQMSNGFTFDVDNTWSTATWSATGPNSCAVPSSTEQCKGGGWSNLMTAQGAPYKNQGDCVSFVASAGKSDPHSL
jgi:hypothetical protein